MLGGNFRRFVYLRAFPVFHKLRDTSKQTFPSRKKKWRGYCTCEKCTDALCERRIGGVIVLVRNVLMRFVKQIEVDYDNVIILEVSEELHRTDANVLVVNTYLNPPNSPFYDTCDYDNGIAFWNSVCLVFWKRMKMLLLFYVAIWTLEQGVRFRPILTLHHRVLKRLEVIFGWTTTQVMICLPNAAQEILKKMNTGTIYWYWAQVLIYVFWTEHVMVTRMVSTLTYLLLVIVLLTTL